MNFTTILVNPYHIHAYELLELDVVLRKLMMVVRNSVMEVVHSSVMVVDHSYEKVVVHRS